MSITPAWTLGPSDLSQIPVSEDIRRQIQKVMSKTENPNAHAYLRAAHRSLLMYEEEMQHDGSMPPKTAT